MTDDFKNKIKKYSEYNPFNNKFNAEIIRNNLISNYDNIDNTTVDLFKTCILLNNLYDQSYQFLVNEIQKTSLTKDDFIKFLISIINRNFYLIKEKQKKFETKSEDFSLTDIRSVTIRSNDDALGDLNLHAISEADVNSLNNILSFYNDDFFSLITEGNFQSLFNFSFNCIWLSHIYSVVKEEFEECIWNGGYTNFNDNNTISLKYYNPERLILKNIGFYRLERNCLTFFLSLKSKIDLTNINNYYYTTKTRKRIDKVGISNGEVTWEIANGVDKNEVHHEIRILSEFTAYYNFLDSENLPKLNNLSLNDVFCLFSLVQYLFENVSEIQYQNDEILKMEDFEKFPYKIKKESLKCYLIKRTTYKKPQINSFLTLLINQNNKKVDFWEFPFIEKDAYLYFSLLAISAPFYVFLTDTWLEKGGFHFQKRGEYLEDYLKKQITSDIQRLGYYFNLPFQKNFSPKKGKNEEIDLIINLKNIVVLGEIKCIKYPKKPRTEHNALKRLEKGAQQIEKKADFVWNNPDFFEEVIGPIGNKKFVKLVITNFPLFTGYHLNEVPVVDFFLLNAYFNTGKIKNEKMYFSNDSTIKSETDSEIIFYKNEDEFCDNFEQCMSYPPAVEDLKEYFEIQNKKITPEYVNFDIFVQSAQWK
jgi:hypothetical protein